MIVCNKRSGMRRQYLKRPLHVGRWCRDQTSSSSEERKQKCYRRNQVQYATDTKACHKSSAEKRSKNGAKTKEQDEPATQDHDPLTTHAVMCVRDGNGIKGG